MKTINTKLAGVLIFDIDRYTDNRGIRENIIDTNEFSKEGVNFICKCQRIYNAEKKGTIYGIHFQDDSHPQAKLIYCIQGKGIDYIVDLKKNSPTYKQWIGININEEDNIHIYVPQGYGHCFVSLEDNTRLLFSTDEAFNKESSRIIKYDDKDINITYPIKIEHVSNKDINAPYLKDLKW